jgi:hypothetical protein
VSGNCSRIEGGKIIMKTLTSGSFGVIVSSTGGGTHSPLISGYQMSLGGAVKLKHRRSQYRRHEHKTWVSSARNVSLKKPRTKISTEWIEITEPNNRRGKSPLNHRNGSRRTEKFTNPKPKNTHRWRFTIAATSTTPTPTSDISLIPNTPRGTNSPRTKRHVRE